MTDLQGSKIPEGWKKVKLGDIIIENKKSKFKVEDADNSGCYPFFTSGDSVLSHSEDLTDGENLFVGDGGVANINYYNGKASYSNHVWSIKTKNEILTKYLYYYILKNLEKIDFKYFTGSGLRNLQKDEFKKEEIIFPKSKEEQQKIAEILEKIDNAIEKTDKIINKYKKIKEGLMQDLLTKGIDENGNIRDEKTHKFKDSPLGRIPEEWEVGYVIDFAEINPITKINPMGIYPHIELDATPIMGRQYKYLSFRKGSEAGSKFMGGDILLARITPSAENGKALLVPSCIKIGIGSTEFIVFRAKENVDKVFLFYMLISDFVRSIAIGLMEGTSGRQRIPNYVFESVIKIAIPKSKEEQQRIAKILTQIDNTIEKEQKYKEKLIKIKNGLMEDLLTGKIRVNNLIEGEEVKNVSQTG